MVVGAEHSQAWTLCGAIEMTTQATMALLGLLLSGEDRHGGVCGWKSGRPLFLAGFAGFAQDPFARVLNALALVGLGGANGSDLGGFIAY